MCVTCILLGLSIRLASAIWMIPTFWGGVVCKCLGGGVPLGLWNPGAKPNQVQVHFVTLYWTKHLKFLPYPNGVTGKFRFTIKCPIECCLNTKGKIKTKASWEVSKELYSFLRISHVELNPHAVCTGAHKHYQEQGTIQGTWMIPTCSLAWYNSLHVSSTFWFSCFKFIRQGDHYSLVNLWSGPIISLLLCLLMQVTA